MNRSSEVSLAVRRALFMGAVASAGVTSMPAHAQDQSQDQQSGDEVQSVTVTGSRIRRVDQETASPVFVLDQTQIAASGVTSIGELVQKVPAIAGAATNPQVNNGGGAGEANIELRGLSPARTLVLLNGRRLNLFGNTTTSSAVDINQLPLNIIERVEVLKEGAGAVYGSDAIAGVVNFITRKSFDGIEANLQAGQTSRSDGRNRVASLLFGNNTEKGSIMVGASYTNQDQVSANDRDFSKYALYLYSGSAYQGGSSRTPNGRINLPSGNSFGCGSVTRLPGTSGTDLSNYRCYTGADAYNYQPFNLLMTPQERSSAFVQGNYTFNDYVEAYTEVLYTHTTSQFAIAPLPFDAVADDIVISKDNIYNPFGIDFGGLAGLNPNLRNRMEVLGSRQGHYLTDAMNLNAGLRGKILDTGWQWDFNAGSSRMQQDNNTDGYILRSALQDAVGPTYTDATGVHCGTAASPIPNCTPINIFNVSDDPATQALLTSISTNYRNQYIYRSYEYNLNATGKIIDLPAGELQVAVGTEYRNQEAEFTTDILTRGQAPQYLSCLLAQETCSGNAAAQYGVRELYAEFFVPLLKDMPGVHSLNLNAGIRRSDYTKASIGTTTNSEFKLEYRPIEDVMLRASYAQVFRAPTIKNLSLAPTQSSTTFTDPCEGITDSDVAANPNLALACQSVPLDGSFSENLSQITGLLTGNPDLKPETGDVQTFGVVYDVSQLPGLSFTVDYWKYTIDDLITNLDANFAIDQCVQTGDPTFCNLIYRYGSDTANAGQIQVFVQPTTNLGNLTTDGVDIGTKYAFRNTPVGTFNLSLDLTHTNSYKNTPTPGAASVEIAGTFDRQFGNYAKWRGLLGVGWAFQNFDGLLTTQYIGKLKVLDPDGAPGVQDPLKIGAVAYLNLTVGYNFPTKTKVQFGIQNLTDKDPPILYMNNVSNANTDVSTYDSLGRRFFLGVTQTF